jgi:hypothetical protein
MASADSLKKPIIASRIGEVAVDISRYARAYTGAYSKGGLVDYTGIAQVHGSPTRPEAFLSANDTSMMRKFLDMAKMFIGVPGMPSIKSSDYAGSEGGVTIEQILIEVDRLDNDTDLERLANKVGEKFARAITTKRGTSIGNLRIK